MRFGIFYILSILGDEEIPWQILNHYDIEPICDSMENSGRTIRPSLWDEYIAPQVMPIPDEFRRIIHMHSDMERQRTEIENAHFWNIEDLTTIWEISLSST